MKSSKRTSFLSLFIIILLALYVAFTSIEVQQLTDRYQKEANEIKEDEWRFIYGILKENIDKGYMNSENIRNKIESQTLEAYKDNIVQLKNDIENPVLESKFSAILRQNLLGAYINVDNDNNDLFVATSSKGIIGDLSENRSTGSDIARSFENEITLHSNKVLAQKAINDILEQNTTKLIGWEFLQSSNKNHIMLSEITEETLRDIFYKEDVVGLSTYEFLQPTYISKDKDIFGIPNISTSGHKNTNNRIIVVQGFNLVDELNKNHSTTIALYEQQLKSLQDNYMSVKVAKQIIFIGFSTCLILAFISIIKIQNMSNSS